MYKMKMSCLGSDVAVAAGRHLTVHADPQSEHPVVVRPAGVVRDHHPVGDHGPRGLSGAGEESEGMAGVEDEGLGVGHGGEVVNHQSELGPVGQHLAETVPALTFMMMMMMMMIIMMSSQ